MKVNANQFKEHAEAEAKSLKLCSTFEGKEQKIEHWRRVAALFALHPFIIDLQPKKDINVNAGWKDSEYEQLVTIDGTAYRVVVRHGRPVRIAFKPRGANRGFQWNVDIYCLAEGGKRVAGGVYSTRTPGIAGLAFWAHVDRLLAKMSSGAKQALLRPANYAMLAYSAQWEADKQLGILDWDGK